MSEDEVLALHKGKFEAIELARRSGERDAGIESSPLFELKASEKELRLALGHLWSIPAAQRSAEEVSDLFTLDNASFIINDKQREYYLRFKGKEKVDFEIRQALDVLRRRRYIQ